VLFRSQPPIRPQVSVGGVIGLPKRKAPPIMKIKNRVRELRYVKASELAPNPKNWRTHPKSQQEALRGILAEVGYADALLARELPDGSLMLVDGHLRAETTPEQEVPVLVLDISEAEADKLLLSLDPLAALAETNAVALDALLREVDTGSEGLQQMYADLAADVRLYADADQKAEQDDAASMGTNYVCPRCGHSWAKLGGSNEDS